MLGGERPLVALLGKRGELVMGAEIIGAESNRAQPAVEAGGERVIDIVEGLFGYGIAVPADAVENAACFGGARTPILLLVGKEGEFESDLGIGGIEAHGLAELFECERVFAGLEVRVGEIFADIGAGGGGGDGLLEGTDGGV